MINKIESALSSPFVSLINLSISCIVAIVVIFIISPVILANIKHAMPKCTFESLLSDKLSYNNEPDNYDNEPDNYDNEPDNED